MAWILVALLLIVAAGLGIVLLRLRSALTSGVAAAADLRSERDAAISAGDALSAKVAALEAEAITLAAGVSEGESAPEPVVAAEEPVVAAEEPAVAAEEPAVAAPEAVVAAEEPVVAAPEAVVDAGVAGGEAAPGPEPVVSAGVTGGEAAAEPEPDVEVRLGALWALAQIEQQRTWRLSMAAGIDGDPGLAGALAMEVDRIREEVGTPGSLATRLDSPVSVNDAALALLAARELLAALVPHTQAYDMTLAQNGSRLAIEVICTGWEGPAAAADDVSRLLAAIAPAGGDLSLDTDADGRLRATMQLPQAG
jgi:hypothetical protein